MAVLHRALEIELSLLRPTHLRRGYLALPTQIGFVSEFDEGRGTAFSLAAGDLIEAGGSLVLLASDRLLAESA